MGNYITSLAKLALGGAFSSHSDFGFVFASSRNRAANCSPASADAFSLEMNLRMSLSNPRAKFDRPRRETALFQAEVQYGGLHGRMLFHATNRYSSYERELQPLSRTFQQSTVGTRSGTDRNIIVDFV